MSRTRWRCICDFLRPLFSRCGWRSQKNKALFLLAFYPRCSNSSNRLVERDETAVKINDSIASRTRDAQVAQTAILAAVVTLVVATFTGRRSAYLMAFVPALLLHSGRSSLRIRATAAAIAGHKYARRDTTNEVQTPIHSSALNAEATR